MNVDERVRGWRGIGPNAGKAVSAEDGFDYACASVGVLRFSPDAPDSEEFRTMLVEWFFSGNWVEEEPEDD